MKSNLITFLLIVKCSWSLPLDQLYPFGPNASDQVLDTSFNFPVFTNGFNFDTIRRNQIYIRPNGIMTFTSHAQWPSFNESSSISSPKPLPIQDIDILAPYWFDSALITCNETFSLNKISFINKTFFPNGTLFFNETNTTSSVNKTTCRYNSTVYYGNRYSSSLEERATKEIRAAFFDTGRYFRIYNLFVVTWVITDTEAESKENVFQCILANGGGNTYVIFNYADGLSQLTNESNPIPVQAGINAALNSSTNITYNSTANFISIPNTSNISVTSNVGIPGVWMFEISTRPFTRPFPPVNVTVNTTDELIVGQSLKLQCRIRRVRAVDATFDIIWTRDLSDERVRSVTKLSGSLITDYTDYYVISELRRSDRFATYRCDVIINLNQTLNASANFVLENVTQAPELIIRPRKSPLRVTVGDHLPIYCIAEKGVPIPEVQWHSEGFPVYPSRTFYQQIYVVPTDVPHTTTYTCMETRYLNRGGQVSELSVNVTVIVEEPCQQLKAPKRGEITITEDGQLAFFSCNQGFTLRGSNILKCKNGKWDSSPPTCNSISRFCRRRCNF